MKTLWLTQYQFDKAQAAAHRLAPHMYLDVMAILVDPPIDPRTAQGISTIGYQALQLRFSRKSRGSQEWVLTTPVQIVPAWLAHQMQTVDDVDEAAW
ncbi:hypothetical protein ACFSUS_11125 [Spirosoma soli]|uniref:Uncharacterized protein n=1 Tax=Spirosoma soli TaxID=1770529 RepID=A0ABW5M2B2_9BACT